MKQVPFKELKLCIYNILSNHDAEVGKKLYCILKHEESKYNYAWLKDLIMYIDALNSDNY